MEIDNKASQPIEVLPADSCEKVQLNWTIKEYIGGEIYRFESNDAIVETALTEKNAITPGMEIAVPGLAGYHRMTVKGDDELYAENEKLCAILKFDIDDRHCWICIGLINKHAISKLPTFDKPCPAC